MKLGLISLPLAGHLHPMIGLAHELQSRGHQTTFFCLPDAEHTVRGAGLEFVPFGEKECPPGAATEGFAHLATLQGEDVLKFTLEKLQPSWCAAVLEGLPGKLKQAGVEAVLIDTIHLFAELVPMSLGLPYVHIWNVLHFDFSGLTPLCATGTPYETTLAAIARNTELAQKFVQACEPTRQIAQRWAKKEGLHVDWDRPDTTLSKLAVITQTPKVFDFPGLPTSAVFHYAGPLSRSEGRQDVSFAWERLDDRPLIYASMGTLVNGSEGVFRSILDAVGQLPQVQLVLSIGNNIDPAKLEPIPANAVVVPVAPQIDLLKRAALCITHAGLNTVLEALSLGVPLVAIPVSFDQPGTASRVAYHGLGEVLSLEALTSETVLAAVRRVLEVPSYRDHTRYFQEAIARHPGPAAAADILEKVLDGRVRPEA